MIRCALLFAVALLMSAAASAESTPPADENQWDVSSPAGRIKVTVALRPQTPSAAPRLMYRVDLKAKGKTLPAIDWSPLGIERSDASFVDGLKLVAAGDAGRIIDNYTLVHGKRSQCEHLGTERRIAFQNPQGQIMELVVHVTNDGVGLAYRFPTASGEPVQVLDELTGIRVPEDARAWLAPFDVTGTYSPAYETFYAEHKPADESPNKEGWAFPAVFKLPEVEGTSLWLLVSETAVDGTYCASRLTNRGPDGVFKLRMPGAAEAMGLGSVYPSSTLPWRTPWRVIVIDDSPARIVESTLATDLSPPSKVADVSWIKPGRASWSWWSDHDSPKNFPALKDFVDLASEMGWEYSLVDANWDYMDHGTVRELAQYAKEKNVGLWLWYNSGGDHNVVSERPRGLMNNTALRQAEFKLLKQWGIVGVKVDFFQSDKQYMMKIYEGILRDAAEAGIMVNFHGCTLPRGWTRTWPNLMSMEAVRGAEQYTLSDAYPARAPACNTMLPFTRNAVGPMDYTPVTFSDDKYPHLTTNGHELALSVIFESGVLHLADRASAYRGLPEAAKTFLKEIPAAWDDTRFVAGEPGVSAAIARRKGDVWYVGVISGVDRKQQIHLPMGFLGEGDYEGILITEGETPRQLVDRKVEATAKGLMELTFLPYGGGVIRLAPKK